MKDPARHLGRSASLDRRRLQPVQLHPFDPPRYVNGSRVSRTGSRAYLHATWEPENHVIGDPRP